MANKVKQIKVELVPNLTSKFGRVYSNFIQVSHSPWDFTLRFCDAPPGGDIPRLRQGNKVEIPTLAEVVIPVTLISPLIRALNDQNEKYIKAFQKSGGIDGKGKREQS